MPIYRGEYDEYHRKPKTDAKTVRPPEREDCKEDKKPIKKLCVYEMVYPFKVEVSIIADCEDDDRKC